MSSCKPPHTLLCDGSRATSRKTTMRGISHGLKYWIIFIVNLQTCPTVVLYGCETWSLTLREERRLRVFENRVLRPKRKEITREWRKLHEEELNDLYASPNTVRVIKSRRMRLAGHIGSMEKRTGVYRFWWGNLRERDHLGDRGVDGRLILRWIFRK